MLMLEEKARPMAGLLFFPTPSGRRRAFSLSKKRSDSSLKNDSPRAVILKETIDLRHQTEERKWEITRRQWRYGVMGIHNKEGNIRQKTVNKARTRVRAEKPHSGGAGTERGHD
jgi:hypothetical protein